MKTSQSIAYGVVFTSHTRIDLHSAHPHNIYSVRKYAMIFTSFCFVCPSIDPWQRGNVYVDVRCDTCAKHT